MQISYLFIYTNATLKKSLYVELRDVSVIFLDTTMANPFSILMKYYFMDPQKKVTNLDI